MIERKKGFTELFSSCFLLIREKMVRISRLAALEGLEVDAESSACHGEEKPGSSCRACRWSSCVFFLWCFETFAYSRLRRPSFCLKIVVDKCLEILFDSASLLSFLYVYFIIFPQGFCGGTDDGCVVQEQGGTGSCVLSSAFSQYFLSHSHVQYLWQLNVSQEAKRKVEVHLKKSRKWSRISALSCSTYTEDC